MPYVPNPQDATEPTDAISVETAAPEFRALKAYIATLILNGGTGAVKNPVRQSVISGPVDANGISATIVASGTLLGVDLKATANVSGLVLSWANGFTVNGANDILQTISNDVLNFWAALPVSSTSYLSVDYVSQAANPTPLSTLAPPQIGRVYNKAAQSLTSLNGNSIDNFGNTWTLAGTATYVSNPVQPAPLIGITNYLSLTTITTDFLSSTSFTSLGYGGWTLRAFVSTGNNSGALTVFEAINSGGFGVIVKLTQTSGTQATFTVSLSSNGASNDIANAVATTLVACSASVFNFVEFTFDALAGVYRLYVRGTQVYSVSSAKIIGPISTVQMGPSTVGNGALLCQFEFLPYCARPAGTGYVVPTIASAFAQGYQSDWFDLDNYMMWQISAASTVAGTNPGMTQKNRLYVGEANTTSSVSAVRAYAINGLYIAPWVTPWPAIATSTSNNDNMGTLDKDVYFELQNLITESGFIPGEILRNPITIDAARGIPPLVHLTKNTILFQTGASTSLVAEVIATGASASLTPANWQYRMRSKRLW